MFFINSFSEELPSTVLIDSISFLSTTYPIQSFAFSAAKSYVIQKQTVLTIAPQDDYYLVECHTTTGSTQYGFTVSTGHYYLYLPLNTASIFLLSSDSSVCLMPQLSVAGSGVRFVSSLYLSKSKFEFSLPK